MSDISERNIRRLDGLSLLVFQALVRTRKATAAAASLGVTQSAVSHTLRRLREALDDPLFLRRPHGLEPTARALALAPLIDAALEALRTAVSGAAAFDPLSSERVVCIAADDSALATLVPSLAARLAERAPRMRVTGSPKVRGEALAALSTRQADLAIGFFFSTPPEFETVALFQETYLVVGPIDHPWFAGDRSLARYAAARHVVMSPQGDLAGIVDRALAARGLAREVIAAAPLFLPAFALASALGALITAPRRVALAHAARFGLRCAEPPLPIRPFTMSVARHRRDARDPAIEWALRQLQAVAAE